MMHMHVKDVHGVVKQEVVLMLIRFDCGKLNWPGTTSLFFELCK